MKRAILVIGLGLVLLSSVVLTRTVRLPSMQMAAESVTDFDLDGRQVAEHLADALRFQTISSQDSTQLRGEEFVGLRRFLEQTYPRVHSTLRREIVGDYSLLYTWSGRDEGLNPILLMGHMDVVPIELGTEDDWTYPPFGGQISEGFIWGRGAMDFKVAVTGILEAVEVLLGQGFQPRRTIHIAFGHDEEVGGHQGAALISSFLRSRGEELEYVLDEGLSITDGIVPNISEPVALVGIAEKGYLTLELVAEGDGGHSSMPPAQTAVGILSTALHRLEQSQFPMRFVGPSRQNLEYLAPEMPFVMRMALANLWLFGGLVKTQIAASPAPDAPYRTTTALTMFEGGIKENVLPTHASAIVNFRILHGDSIQSVMERTLRTVDDPRVQIRPIGRITSNPSSISDTGSPSFQVLQRTIHQVFPGVLVAPGLVVGATDSRHFSGVSRNILRFTPMRMGPEDLGRIHGTDERLSVENYKEIIRFFVQLIHNSAQ